MGNAFGDYQENRGGYRLNYQGYVLFSHFE